MLLVKQVACSFILSLYAQSVLKVMPFQRAFVPSLWALEAASVMLKAEKKNIIIRRQV